MAFGSPEAAPPPQRYRTGCLAFAGLSVILLAILVGRLVWERAWTASARGKVFGLVLEQQNAWNGGNLPAFTATYRMHEDVTFYSEGRVYKGWEQLNDRYRQMYGGRPMGELTYSDMVIDILNTDAAVVRGTWALKSDAGTRTGLFTMLVRRFPLEDWKVVHDHMTIGELR